MGKAQNARVWAEFEHLDSKKQEQSFEYEPLTPEELELIEEQEAEKLRLDREYAINLYAMPTWHVRLGNEPMVGQ